MNFLTVNTKLPAYMAFPRFLLDMQINETTKLLYMLLLDRTRLSLKNKGWTDENGHVFIYFTIENIAKILHKSQMTVKTSLSALETADLIFRKRRGVGHPNRIYVKLPSDAFTQTNSSPSQEHTENSPADRKYSFSATDRILSDSKNNFSENNSSQYTDSNFLSPLGTFQNVFLLEHELADLKKSVPDWKEYIERLSSYMASTGRKYQNHAATIKSWALKDKPATRQRNYECKDYETL